MGDRKNPANGQSALSIAWKSAASAGVILAAAKLARRLARNRVDLRGKVVLITGSRGLALAIARELGRHGARIALCARDAEELGRACEILAHDQIEAAPFPADLTVESAIAPLVEKVLSRFGGIDILVNNAGEISVGPLESFAHADFEHAMNLMFWAAVNLTFAVLPYMKRRRRGLIVNITSLGGRVSIPHLLPYSCAKFALVGFSTGLTAELPLQGVHVLTVVPGLMRTGSYLNAQFRGDASGEFAWFALLGNLPGISVAAGYAAGCIRHAIERQRSVCTISVPAKLLIACDALLPQTTRRMLELVNRVLLPSPRPFENARIGAELNARFGKVFQGFTIMGRNAAGDLNE